MRPHDNQIWLKSRSAATQRFVKFGGISFLAAFAIVTLQFVIWLGAGWGSANFLPGWLFGLCLGFAILVGVSMAYTLVALSAHSEGQIKWGVSAFAGVFATGVVMLALAHSLPQLSTLVVSTPKLLTLNAHFSHFRTPGSRTGRGCGHFTSFGPWYAFKGGWCGVHMAEGKSFAVEGRGNAIAARLERVLR